MDWFIFVVVALAVHRVTVLIIEDKITEPLRDRLFEKLNPQETWTYLFTCPWCVSIWLGAFAALGFYFFPLVAFWIAFPFALSSITGLIEEKR